MPMAWKRRAGSSVTPYWSVARVAAGLVIAVVHLLVRPVRRRDPVLGSLTGRAATRSGPENQRVGDRAVLGIETVRAGDGDVLAHLADIHCELSRPLLIKTVATVQPPSARRASGQASGRGTWTGR